MQSLAFLELHLDEDVANDKISEVSNIEAIAG